MFQTCLATTPCTYIMHLIIARMKLSVAKGIIIIYRSMHYKDLIAAVYVRTCIDTENYMLL